MEASFDQLRLRGILDQDRVEVLSVHGGHVLVVADGAGGTSGGEEAADAVLAAVREAAEAGEHDWSRVLRDVDRSITDEGRAAAVVVEVRGGDAVGSSVGNSGATVFADEGRLDLTAEQRRKPLLGSARATPVSFSHHIDAPATLVVATDGLWSYATSEMIADRLEAVELEDACETLVDGVRLPSGGLPDDVGVIVYRVG